MVLKELQKPREKDAIEKSLPACHYIFVNFGAMTSSQILKNTATKKRVLKHKIFHPIVYCIYLIQNELLVDLNKIGRK